MFPAESAAVNKALFGEIPAWRFGFWGVVAALGVCAVGVMIHDTRLFLFAPFAGLVMAGFGLVIYRSQQRRWPARQLRLLLLIYVVSQAILLVLKIVELCRR